MALERFFEDPLQCGVFPFFVEDRRSQVTAVKGVVTSAGFVGIGGRPKIINS